MADLSQLEAALVKADAAGNADDARAFAAEIRRMRAATAAKPTPTFTPGPAGFRQSLNEAIAADVSPLGAQVVGGIGTALDQAALRLKQLGGKVGLGSGLTPQDTQKVEANRMLTDTPAGLGGALLGSTMMFGGVPAGSLPAAAATGGAISTVSNPVLPGESEIANTALGAAGAGAGNLLVSGASRIAQPIRQSSPVRALLDEGIVPTPGQAAGPNSLLGRLEQGLSSLPIIGQIMRGGRTRAIEEMNSAAINRAMPAGSPRVNQIGREAMQQADDLFDNAYSQALQKVQVSNVPGTLQGAYAKAKADPDLFLTDQGEQFVDRFLRSIESKTGTGQISGELAKKIDSQIGAKAREYSASSLASERDIGKTLRQLQAEFRIGLEAAAPELKGINSKYAEFLRVQRAAGYTGAEGGAFSPSQYQSAVRAMDPSRNKRAFAQGNALGQDLSDPAYRVLRDTVPNSGTPERALAAGLIGASAGGLNEYYGGPGYLSLLAASPLLYSRAGSRYMLGDLPGQQAAARGILSIAPPMEQLGRLLAEKYQQ